MAFSPSDITHAPLPRRQILQAGSLGLMGMSLSDLLAWEARAKEAGVDNGPKRSVIYIFLSGGLSQHESFDPKPEAPAQIRGEFSPIPTQTPGLFISEHLPQLAARSKMWSLVRSLTHSQNGHGAGIHIMNTGMSAIPPGFNQNKPQSTDFPSMLSVVNSLTSGVHSLPASVMLPRLVTTVRHDIRPGQFAGMMGSQHDPWVLNAADKCDGYGACPNCFHFSNKPKFEHTAQPVFQAPNLNLPDGLSLNRLNRRANLLDTIERAQRGLEGGRAARSMNKYREGALSLLTSGKVRAAFNLENEDPKRLDRYGRDLFGWSLLLARRLVETDVRMVQVNLGRGSTWDQHGDIFPVLGKLLPLLDRSVSALLDDLNESGLLETTTIVMCGEFGRTPKIKKLGVYKLPGRDHWGPLNSVLFAGGSITPGLTVGSSDKIGAYPISAAQSPENFAATIYEALGVRDDAHWYDVNRRPYRVYNARPIEGLTT